MRFTKHQMENCVQTTVARKLSKHRTRWRLFFLISIIGAFLLGVYNSEYSKTKITSAWLNTKEFVTDLLK